MASGGKKKVSQEYELSSEAPWYLHEAMDDIGLREFEMKNGKSVSNPLVEKFYCQAMFGDDSSKWPEERIDARKVPWCAYWIGAKLVEGGYPSTRSGMARSYLKYGTKVGLDPSNWKPGDIMVWWRGKTDDGVSGHVNFFLERNGKTILCVGGNQGDMVCIEEYTDRKLLDVRRPRSVTSAKTMKGIAGAGTNETVVRPTALAVEKLSSGAQPPATPVKLPDLPDPTAIHDQLEPFKSPLEQLSGFLPNIHVVLTLITIACLVYAAYYRWKDYKEGQNT